MMRVARVDLRRPIVVVQVDKEMFETTQRLLTNIRQAKYLMEIQERFDIDWASVEWSDLRKPLYSALGARLFVEFKNCGDGDAGGSIPRTIDDQARFWRTHYRPDADEQYFRSRATKFENREYNFVVITLKLCYFDFLPSGAEQRKPQTSLRCTVVLIELRRPTLAYHTEHK